MRGNDRILTSVFVSTGLTTNQQPLTQPFFSILEKYASKNGTSNKAPSIQNGRLNEHMLREELAMSYT